MLIGNYNKPVLLTYCGIVISLLGMMLSLGGEIRYGFVCLIAAGICDLFDGRFANLFKRSAYEKGFGVEIDSLGDMINFAAFPVVLFYSLGLTQWWHLLLFSFYVLAAVTRLAHFNVVAKQHEASQRPTYFQGLPVTYSALIFPVVWLMCHWWWPSGLSTVFPCTILVVGLLFVLNVKIPKPGLKLYVFFGALALLVSYLILSVGGEGR